jgi:hypothetical protein
VKFKTVVRIQVGALSAASQPPYAWKGLAK